MPRVSRVHHLCLINKPKIDAIGTVNKHGLLAQNDPAQMTIIDNGSNAEPIDDIVDSIEARQDININVICNDTNVGYGRAHNQAIMSSNADIHLILNPDVELDNDALKEGLAHLAENTQSALLGPSGRDKNNNPAKLAKRYPTLLDLFLRGFAPGFITNRFAERLAYYECRDLDHFRPAQVPIVSGCMMLARTDLLQQISGFDPSFFLYFEDFDLSLRASALGHVVYLPKMKINHHGGNAAKKGVMHIALFARSAIRFFNKHGWRFF